MDAGATYMLSKAHRCLLSTTPGLVQCSPRYWHTVAPEDLSDPDTARRSKQCTPRTLPHRHKTKLRRRKVSAMLYVTQSGCLQKEWDNHCDARAAAKLQDCCCIHAEAMQMNARVVMSLQYSRKHVQCTM